MKTSTALKRRNLAIDFIRGIFSSARHFGLTSEEMHARIRKIENEYLAKTPQWCRSYVGGYTACLFQTLYQDGSLIHGAFVNGMFYSTHRTRDDYYSNHGFGAADFAKASKQNHGHYWAHNLQPFFVVKEST